MAKKKFTTKKYEGDDSYSWAVFDAADVRGMKGIIFSYQARPVMCGMSRSSAQAKAKQLTVEATNHD